MPENNRYNGERSRDSRQRPAFSPINAEPLPADYLDRAENLIQGNTCKITTSKIRRLYSLFTEVYDRERLRTEDTLLPEDVAAVAMMRVRIAYESGRDPEVEKFVKKTKLLNYLKDVDDDRETFISLTQYMEALVAYHKFFNGGEG